MIDPLSHAYVEHLKASPECMQAYDEGRSRIALRCTAKGFEYYCEACKTPLED